MATQRKPSITLSNTLTGTIPPLPVVPRGTINRFQELGDYDEQMQRWWSRFGEMNQRDREQLQSAIKAAESADDAAIAAANASIATLQEQVAVLQAQVAALSGEGTDIAALQLQVNDHIASEQAHGTTGDVVGTIDVQNLDAKTIGLYTPGYGRFTPLVGLARLEHGTSVVIASDEFMLVAGEFDVVGDLTIEGTLAAL